jgi:1-acyl-sn-glycerol-3-phosphate acyltransferase
LRLKIIPVDRTVGKSDVRGLILARKAISRGANIVLFPEGGRTFKGTKNLQSKTGKELRPLKGGFALLAAELGVVLVPVWFEFKGWRCMRLTVGEPKNFHGVLRGEIVKETEKILLELADKTD